MKRFSKEGILWLGLGAVLSLGAVFCDNVSGLFGDDLMPDYIPVQVSDDDSMVDPDIFY